VAGENKHLRRRMKRYAGWVWWLTPIAQAIWKAEAEESQSYLKNKLK
jgi:hypothetical protein